MLSSKAPHDDGSRFKFWSRRTKEFKGPIWYMADEDGIDKSDDKKKLPDLVCYDTLK